MTRKDTGREKDDLYRHRMGLACIALAEVPAPVRERMKYWVDRLTKKVYEFQRLRVEEELSAGLGYFRGSIVAAARLNGKIGKRRFIDLLLQDLRGDEWMAVLCEAQATPSVRAVLLRDLRDSSDRLRCFAATALGKLGETAADVNVVHALRHALTKDTWYPVRESAAKALGELKEASATLDVVRALLQAVTDEKELGVRNAAAETLGELGEVAATPEVFRVLLQIITDDTATFLPTYAVRALSRVCKPETVRVLLLDLAKHANPEMRSRAMWLLSELGESAANHDVVRVLLQAVTSDAETNVREWAAICLGKLGRADATDEVVKILLRAVTGDADPKVRGSAISALGNLRDAAANEEVVRVLLRAVTDDADREVRAQAIWALGDLRDAAATEDVTRVLLRALSNKNYLIRWFATHTLGEISEATVTEEVKKILLQAARILKSRLSKRHSGFLGYEMCFAEAMTVGKFGKVLGTDEVVKTLLHTLTDSRPDCEDSCSHRYYGAMVALGALGNAAATAEVVNVLLQWATARFGRGYAANALVALQKLRPGVRIFKRRTGCSRYAVAKVTDLAELPVPFAVREVRSS